MDWTRRKVLVTGGASFIGSHLVDALVAKGAHVRVVDNLSSGHEANLREHVARGVVELLRPLVGYARGAGVDARWLVIDGSPEFFAITKRIHNRLHGAEGDGGPLDDSAREVYEAVLEQNTAAITGRVRAGDVVIVHDPQPAGMVASFVDAGASAIWRCHVGLDRPNDRAREAWAFLRPYILPADRYVFSRESFAWEGLDRDRLVVIPPSIDAFAPKNVDLGPDTVLAVLRDSGVGSDFLRQLHPPPAHGLSMRRRCHG